jgi:hypothetical protein
MAKVVLDLHGARAKNGVDVDALESFFDHFRAALREYDRAERGDIPKKGGRPGAREAAATAFRLVDFRTGSGIATLEPIAPGELIEEDPMLQFGEPLSITTLTSLVEAIEQHMRLPPPVVEELNAARRAIGDDGSFGVAVSNGRQPVRVVIDAMCVKQLQQPQEYALEGPVALTGRMHMIEADLPNRRVGIRAQDGVDWTCSYPDHLHSLVTKLVERIVRVQGTGRKLTPATGRLAIEQLEPIPEHVQDTLFTVDTVPAEQLRAEQHIDRPQGLDALADPEWKDDEEGRRFLEATLGSRAE